MRKIEGIDGLVVLLVHRIEFSDVDPSFERIWIEVEQPVVVPDGVLEIGLHLVGISQIDQYFGIGIVYFQTLFQERHRPFVILDVVHDETYFGYEMIKFIDAQIIFHRFIDDAVGLFRPVELEKGFHPEQRQLDGAIIGNILEIGSRLFI